MRVSPGQISVSTVGTRRRPATRVPFRLTSRTYQRPSTDRAKARFLARVNYYGQQVRLDVQGRILIPQLLRESAGMNGDVVVTGQLDHLVVWNHERFLRLLEEEPLTDEDFRALTQYGI